MGAPRMQEVLGYEGETASLNRIARLMAGADLSGIPQKRSWRHKRSGVRPAHVRNHLARDFAALDPNTKWVVDITYILTGEGWLYLCAAGTVLGQGRGLVDGASAGSVPGAEGCDDGDLAAFGSQSGHPAFWSRHAAHQCRVPTVPEGPAHRQQHERRWPLRGARSLPLGCNAAAEGFFGKLKREPVHRQRYLTLAEARSDVFDYIERFQPPPHPAKARCQGSGL